MKGNKKAFVFVRLSRKSRVPGLRTASELSPSEAPDLEPLSERRLLPSMAVLSSKDIVRMVRKFTKDIVKELLKFPCAGLLGILLASMIIGANYLYKPGCGQHHGDTLQPCPGRAWEVEGRLIIT